MAKGVGGSGTIGEQRIGNDCSFDAYAYSTVYTSTKTTLTLTGGISRVNLGQ